MAIPTTEAQGRSSASILFTTEDIHQAGRLEAWNAAFGTLNAVTLLGEQVPGVRCENWFLNGLVLSETRVTGGRFDRDPTRARRDGLDHWILRVMRRGRGALRHPGFTAITRPGDLVLFSMHETWTAEWDDVEWVTLCIPRDFDLRLSAALGTLHPGILHGAGAGLVADLLLALPARIAGARPDEIEGLARVVHAMIGSSLPMCPEVGEAVETRGAGDWARERVRRAILRDVGLARLTPEHLAATVGMSRSALYRLFESEGGVARYIRDVRLSLAHTALSNCGSEGRSIAAIAEAHGFPDPASFSRAFRSVYGVSPRDVREPGLAGIPLQSKRRTLRSGDGPELDLAGRSLHAGG